VPLQLAGGGRDDSRVKTAGLAGLAELAELAGLSGIDESRGPQVVLAGAIGLQ